MSDYSQGEGRSVLAMFANIAERYDLLNRLMTFGQDRRWRREAVSKLKLGSEARVADVGCGTGALAHEITRQRPQATVIACDFTPEMIAVGRKRKGAEKVHWLLADAHHLPFANASMDGLVSGFLLRNVSDLKLALTEQWRTLKAGGRVAALDTTPPGKSPLRPLLNFHLKRIIPLMGRLIAGDAAAYEYLPASTAGFLSGEQLQERFRSAGFSSVQFRRRMLDTIAIHWGKKK